MRFSPLMLTCAAAAVLSACTTMDTNHPDKMYRQAVMNNIQKDNQYNFSGKVSLQVEEVKEASAAVSAASASTNSDADAVTSAEVDAAAEEMKESASAITETVENSDETHTHTLAWEELNDEILEAVQKNYPMVEPFLKNSAMHVDGAMDLQQGKLEMIPSLNISTHNYGMWAKLPMQVDGKRQSILMDVRGYLGWLQNGYWLPNTEVKGLKRLEQGALLEINQPEDVKERYPIKTVFKALPKGLEGYLGAMDASKFKLVPLDDYGRQINAAYQVQLEYDYVDSWKWSKAMLQSYNQEFLRLQREEPEEGISEKAYNDVKSALLLGAMMMGGDENSCKQADEGENLVDENTNDSLACSGKEMQQELEKMMAGSPKMLHSLYLTRSGRIVGVQDKMVLRGKKSPQQMVYLSQMKFHDYGRPTFTLDAAKQPTVSIWELIKEIKQADSSDSDEYETFDAAEAAVEAVEAAEAAAAQ